MPNTPQKITPEQQAKLRKLIQELRVIAGPVGPLHGFWETIFDLEALLQGQPTFLPMTVDEHIAAAEEQLS